MLDASSPSDSLSNSSLRVATIALKISCLDLFVKFVAKLLINFQNLN